MEFDDFLEAMYESRFEIEEDDDVFFEDEDELEENSVPQTVEEFISLYPEKPGMSVYACTVLVQGEETFALGETSIWVWQQIKERGLQVLAILYAGQDRNEAIRLQDTINSSK